MRSTSELSDNAITSDMHWQSNSTARCTRITTLVVDHRKTNKDNRCLRLWCLNCDAKYVFAKSCRRGLRSSIDESTTTTTKQIKRSRTCRAIERPMPASLPTLRLVISWLATPRNVPYLIIDDKWKALRMVCCCCCCFYKTFAVGEMVDIEANRTKSTIDNDQRKKKIYKANANVTRKR